MTPCRSLFNNDSDEGEFAGFTGDLEDYDMEEDEDEYVDTHPLPLHNV